MSPLPDLGGLGRLSAPQPPAEDLSGLTKQQLLDLAAERGISGVSSRNTKAEIIAAIEEA